MLVISSHPEVLLLVATLILIFLPSLQLIASSLLRLTASRVLVATGIIMISALVSLVDLVFTSWNSSFRKTQVSQFAAIIVAGIHV